eukprot:Rmarinus@m.21226
MTQQQEAARGFDDAIRRVRDELQSIESAFSESMQMVEMQNTVMTLLGERVCSMDEVQIRKNAAIGGGILEAGDLKETLLAERQKLAAKEFFVQAQDREIEQLKRSLEEMTREMQEWRTRALSSDNRDGSWVDSATNTDLCLRAERAEERVQVLEQLVFRRDGELQSATERAMKAEHEAAVAQSQLLNEKESCSAVTVSRLEHVLEEKTNELGAVTTKCEELKNDASAKDDIITKQKSRISELESQLQNLKRQVNNEEFKQETPAPVTGLRRKSTIGNSFDLPGVQEQEMDSNLHILRKNAGKFVTDAVRRQSVVLAAADLERFSSTDADSVPSGLSIRALMYEGCLRNVLNDHITVTGVLLTVTGGLSSECFIEWYKSLRGGPFTPLKVTGPSYHPTADDIECVVRVCVTPVRNDNQVGPQLSMDTPPLVVEKDVLMRMHGFSREGQVEFNVLLTGAGLLEVPGVLFANREKLKIRIGSNTIFKCGHEEGTQVLLGEDSVNFIISVPAKVSRSKSFLRAGGPSGGGRAAAKFTIRTQSTLERDFVVLTLRMFVNGTSLSSSTKIGTA